MKLLILARHAHSSQATAGKRDFDRPLSHRGIRDAQSMGQNLKLRLDTSKLRVDQFVTSRALRALQTAHELANAIGHSPTEIQQITAIYNTNSRELIKLLSRLPEHATSALIVGHNPTLTDCSKELCSTANLNMPSGAIACLELAVDSWQQIYQDCAELRWFDHP